MYGHKQDVLPFSIIKNRDFSVFILRIMSRTSSRFSLIFRLASTDFALLSVSPYVPRSSHTWGIHSVFLVYIVIIILPFSYRCCYFSCAAGRGAGGGCYSFVYAIYVCRPKGLRRFGRSIDHFGLESGLVFEGTTGVYEGICRFNSKWIRNEEKFANSKRT